MGKQFPAPFFISIRITYNAMAKYKVEVASVTGVVGKQLTEGNVYEEFEFNGAHIPELIEIGAITIVPEETAPAENDNGKPSKKQ